MKNDLNFLQKTEDKRTHKKPYKFHNLYVQSAVIVNINNATHTHTNLSLLIDGWSRVYFKSSSST